MDHICQECKQKAEFICICNNSYMCKGCREAHKKKYKGPHKILLYNDPDLENIRKSIENSKKLSQGKIPSEAPSPVKKDPEDPPELASEKSKLKSAISSDLKKIADTREEIFSSIKGQAKSLIQSIADKYSSATKAFESECLEKENILIRALEHLSSSNEISSNTLLCKMLDFPSLSDIELLSYKSSVYEESISLEKCLDFNIDFVKLEESNQIADYYKANLDSMHPSMKSLYESILNEKNFSTTTIKLSKVPLNREGLVQFVMIIKSFPGLKVLQLSENEIGLEAIKKIGPCLAELTSLKKLMISKNPLKGNGGKQLALYLKSLNELIALDLSGNKFGTEGIKPICATLQSLTKLKSLKLMNDGIEDSCTSALVTCFSALKKLKTLRLKGNSLHADERSLIEDHIPDNCDIKF